MQNSSLVPAQQRAGGWRNRAPPTTQTPRRPIGAGGGRGAVVTTRSLCEESPAQTEQWRCWFCRRRIIFGSGEIAAIRSHLSHAAMQIDDAQNTGRNRTELRIPTAAAQTRVVSVARIRPGRRKSVRPFKDDISEVQFLPPQPRSLASVGYVQVAKLCAADRRRHAAGKSAIFLDSTGRDGAHDRHGPHQQQRRDRRASGCERR